MKYFGAICLLLITLPVKAQLQVKGGLQLTTISGTQYLKAEPRVGFYLGAGKSFELSKRISFEPSVMYSLQGYKVDGGDTRLHYLLVPMNFKFDVISNFGLMAGPQIGMAVHAVAHYDGGPGYDPITFAATPTIKLLNLSFGVGPYYRINDRLVIELRAVFDLTNIDSSTRNFDLRNSVYQGGVSMLINSPADK